MKKIWKKLSNLVQSGSRYLYIVIAVIFSFILFAIIYTSIAPQELDYRVGQVANTTIRANKTIENKADTEEAKNLAEEAVTTEYSYDDKVKDTQVDDIQNLFVLIREVNKELTEKHDQSVAKASGEAVADVSTDDKVAALKKKFENVDQDRLSLYQSFPATFYTSIFELSDTELDTVEKDAVSIISEHMSNRIRESNLKTEKNSATDQIEYMDLTNEERIAMKYLIDYGIVVNEVENTSRTDELKAQARSNVSPVMIYLGEIIVREGDQITKKAMQKLEVLGMTSKNQSIYPIVSLILLLILQLVILLSVGFKEPNDALRIRTIAFYSVTMSVAVILMKFLEVFQTNTMTYVPLIFPAAFVPLVLNLFISRKISLISVVFQFALALFVFYESIGTSSLLIIVVSYAFAGVVATLLERRRIGEQIIPALLWIIAIPILFTIILIIYQGMSWTDSSTWSTVICALMGNLLSFIMSIGLHPYFELVLDDDSMIVLNELSNPNHPLLKKLLEEAPGTYNHSMMVANLSSNAVAEIGGKSALTRVACYYHDIGKIKHANFFVENLPAGAENPHNFLLPEDSKEIIFSHVTEGVKMLKAEKMPQFVIDVCQEHHGTTLMKYFYVKAKERNPEVTQAEFRYPGPKPQSRESAVISIADSAEASSRAMDNPTNEKIKELVHSLVISRLEDGQFDECGLTMAEIHKVEKSIINGLCSTLHTRIKYPKMQSEAEEMKREQEAAIE